MPDGSEQEENLKMGERRANPPANLDVIAYQVGALQTALSTGLHSIERSMEKGLGAIDVRLGRMEERQGSMDRQLERQSARIEALEDFRREQEDREKAIAVLKEAELKAAVDGSNTAKMTRTIVGWGVAFIGLIATIAAIINTIGGPS